jgi:hypothetical protein
MPIRLLFLPLEQWAWIKAEGPIDESFHNLLLEIMEYGNKRNGTGPNAVAMPRPGPIDHSPLWNTC